MGNSLGDRCCQRGQIVDRLGIAEKLDIQSKKLCWLVCYEHSELSHQEEGLSYPVLLRKSETQIVKGYISSWMSRVRTSLTLIRNYLKL